MLKELFGADDTGSARPTTFKNVKLPATAPKQLAAKKVESLWNKMFSAPKQHWGFYPEKPDASGDDEPGQGGAADGAAGAANAKGKGKKRKKETEKKVPGTRVGRPPSKLRAAAAGSKSLMASWLASAAREDGPAT